MTPIGKRGVSCGYAGFEQTAAQMAGLRQQQTYVQRAVAAGELWMDAGVAESAAQRCEQAIQEIDGWLSDAERLIKRRKFGKNEDGLQTAARYAHAGLDFIEAMKGAQVVFANMTATYRAAGRTVAAADAARVMIMPLPWEAVGEAVGDAAGGVARGAERLQGATAGTAEGSGGVIVLSPWVGPRGVFCGYAGFRAGRCADGGPSPAADGPAAGGGCGRAVDGGRSR